MVYAGMLHCVIVSHGLWVIVSYGFLMTHHDSHKLCAFSLWVMWAVVGGTFKRAQNGEPYTNLHTDIFFSYQQNITHIDTQTDFFYMRQGFERRSLRHANAAHTPHTFAHTYAKFAYCDFFAKRYCVAYIHYANMRHRIEKHAVKPKLQ